MLKWFFKKIKKIEAPSSSFESRPIENEYIDGIEKSLWEIKEIYDLPTEEIVMTVRSKRKNLQYMHKIIKNNEKKSK